LAYRVRTGNLFSDTNDLKNSMPELPDKTKKTTNEFNRPAYVNLTKGSSDKVFIPESSFVMGANSQVENEPAHIVKLRSFYIGRKEVTIGEYIGYCNSQGKALPEQPYHRFPDYYPVVNITWDQALAYSKYVGGRLPTEAEWEYAAGAGLQTKYSGGNNASLVAVYGNKLKTCKVASKGSNSFGLYDMSGNAAEWCSDWFDPVYYPKSNMNNPDGPTIGAMRVVRGGAYNTPVNQLRITCRIKEFPDSARTYIGFRVVWDENKIK
jgi:sulfatase modifying factor 1